MIHPPPPAGPDPDVWVLVFRALAHDVPAPHRVKRLLKWADSLGLKLVRCRDASNTEDGTLEATIDALCERVWAQAELLAKRAEKGVGDAVQAEGV